MIKSRYQQQYIREAHHHHHHQHQQQQQVELSGEKVEVCRDRSQVQSTRINVSEGDVDEVNRGGQSPPSDVIPALRQSVSPPVSVLASRPRYIHRPFEDAPAPNDTERFLGVDGRLRAMLVDERRHGWLARHCYQLGSVDGGSGSWQLGEVSGVGDDDIGSSGDSACCDDDDVSDEQVPEDKAINNSLHTERYDVTDDDTTPNHYQPQHTRKPGSYNNNNLCMQPVCR